MLYSSLFVTKWNRFFVFQSSKPLALFLYREYGDIILSLTKRVVKPEVFEPEEGRPLTLRQICQLDLDKEDNFLVAKRVGIGFSCKNELKQIEKDKAKLKVTDREILQFKDKCRQFIIAMVKKLNERSPLKCAAV